MTTMTYLLLTIFVLPIVTAALVGAAYFVSLRLAWIPKARDDDQLHRSPKPPILTDTTYATGHITISKFDFEAIDLVSIKLPNLLVEKQIGSYAGRPLMFAFVTNSTLGWGQNRNINIVQFPIRERPDILLSMVGMTREAALG